MFKYNYDFYMETGYKILCDLVVLCKDGEIQYIKDVTVSYTFKTKERRYFKGFYLIQDYYFVDEILLIENERLEL